MKIEYTLIEKLERTTTITLENPDNLAGEDLEAFAQEPLYEYIAEKGWDCETVLESSIETKEVTT